MHVWRLNAVEFDGNSNSSNSGPRSISPVERRVYLMMPSLFSSPLNIKNWLIDPQRTVFMRGPKKPPELKSFCSKNGQNPSKQEGKDS